MRLIIMVAVITFGLLPVYAQEMKAKRTQVTLDTVTIFHDIFKGSLPGKMGSSVSAVLQLNHKQYCDYGSFSLNETNSTARHMPVTALGDWTVLRGDAVDENATVVELDAPDRVLYFLRRKDGSLQQLDTSLREIKPVSSYILRKSNEKTTVVNYAGTYTGSLPCADCNRIETMLMLQCKKPCSSGNYTLRDKYVGTPKGDQAYTRRGVWKIEADMIANKRTIIALDAGKPGKQSFYLVKKDGNLVQLDNHKQAVETPFDQTLKKK